MTFPNQLTLLRILLTPIFVCLLLSPNPIMNFAAMGVFLIASLTDWYDGYFARKYGYVSKWGKFLDPLADKILVSAAFFCLVYLDVVRLWMVIIIVIRDFSITGLRSYAMFRGTPVVTSRLAKIKTTVQMTVVYLLLFYYVISQNYGYWEPLENILRSFYIFDSLMFITTALTVFTMIQYFIANRQNLKNMAVDLLHIFSKNEEK